MKILYQNPISLTTLNIHSAKCLLNYISALKSIILWILFLEKRFRQGKYWPNLYLSRNGKLPNPFHSHPKKEAARIWTFQSCATEKKPKILYVYYPLLLSLYRGLAMPAFCRLVVLPPSGVVSRQQAIIFTNRFVWGNWNLKLKILKTETWRKLKLEKNSLKETREENEITADVSFTKDSFFERNFAETSGNSFGVSYLLPVYQRRKKIISERFWMSLLELLYRTICC